MRGVRGAGTARTVTPVPERTWDVLIVAGPGLATDRAHAPHGQLARRDLRVMLDVASMPSASAFPAGHPEDACWPT